jgi:hypothetical protein
VAPTSDVQPTSGTARSARPAATMAITRDMPMPRRAVTRGAAIAPTKKPALLTVKMIPTSAGASPNARVM